MIERDDNGARHADELIRYADDLRVWAGAIDDAAGALAAVVAVLPGVWADAAGREWTERIRLVGTELARRMEEAENLARDAERRAAPAPDLGAPFGVRLGSQSGTRATDRRGMVVPGLPPP